DYTVDARFGGDEALAVARAELAARDVRLVLDLVPNHIAPDHRWVTERPELLVRGDHDDLRRDPDSFLEVAGRVFARGRDPNFPAWPEVLQLDASSSDLRAAMAELVVELTERCDGLRCDMAMLVLDGVFHRTWGDRATGGASPDGGRGYWPTVLSAARRARPGFIFWAEAYWDLESVLVEQGFDACYDKRLYDRLVHGAAVEIRAHLDTDVATQQHMLRFVENHDEPRGASVFEQAAHRAALTTVFTVPGVALLHEGQADGRRIRVPVTLARRPDETVDVDFHAFVDRLLDALAGGLRVGEWSLVTIEGWPGNRSADQMVGWTWTSPASRHLIVVNLSEHRADGRVRLAWPDLDGRDVVLVDLLSGREYERHGTELARHGLYVALDGHGTHLLQVTVG
ncbi:MAG: alpha-amylase family glycosyl hydrolase, partial [Acidimicrobiales bacterium]